MIKYKLSSEFVIFENCTMPKKKTRQLLLLCMILHAVITQVSMWKFMNSVWHRKWIVWHMNTDYKYYI